MLSVPEALGTPQVRHRELLQTFADVPGLGRSVTLTGPVSKCRKAIRRSSSPPPQLGQHTDEVLRDIGFDDSEIARLEKRGSRMSDKQAPTADQLLQQATAWWSTSIINIHPGEIVVRGYPIQELIGELTLPSNDLADAQGRSADRAAGETAGGCAGRRR